MRRRLELVALLVVIAGFLLLAFPGAGTRGVTAEEVQPYLARHPMVLEAQGDRIELMPPHESGAPPRPRWVRTRQWPVLAWDGTSRLWPVFIRGHQTALGSYVGIALGPLLGGGVAGVQRSSVLLTACLVPLAWFIARRSSVAKDAPTAPLLSAVLVALSFGTLFFGRTGYAFEISSRVWMFAALAIAAPRVPPSRARAVAIGAAAGIAILCRATIAVTMLPALAVLLVDPSRAAPLRRRAVIVAVLAGLPLALVALVHLLIGFTSGTAPLAQFPLAELPRRALGAPFHLLVQLAWLGDAGAILGPVRTTVRSEPHLGVAVVLAAIPIGAAIVRAFRRVAGDGERMLVAGLAGNVLGGALLYGDPWQFQLAMALDPLLAIAIAEQVASLPARRALVIAAVAWFVRAQSTFVGLRVDQRCANPMFSGRAQLAAVDKMHELSVRGPEVLTTNYNHAGVVEAWTSGAITPIHAWDILKTTGRGDDVRFQSAFRTILVRHRPRYVLLSVGENPYDGPFTDNVLTKRALEAAVTETGGHVANAWMFPTETGGPGLALVEIARP